jgi:hypothetical protein
VHVRNSSGCTWCFVVTLGRFFACSSHLGLDLTGISVIGNDIVSSGVSTPNNASSDRGVFSSDEMDFKEIKKSSLALQATCTGGACSRISPVSELVFEDPDMADWQDLSVLIYPRFSQFLRMGTSRYLSSLPAPK